MFQAFSYPVTNPTLQETIRLADIRRLLSLSPARNGPWCVTFSSFGAASHAGNLSSPTSSTQPSCCQPGQPQQQIYTSEAASSSSLRAEDTPPAFSPISFAGIPARSQREEIMRRTRTSPIVNTTASMALIAALAPKRRKKSWIGPDCARMSYWAAR